MTDRSSVTVIIGGDDRPLIDAEAVCEGCGVRGTVGRAVRSGANGNPVEEHRFCAECWPEWSAFYRARWEDRVRRATLAWQDQPPGASIEPPAPSGMWFESATWHGVIDVVKRLMRESRYYRDPPSREALARVASEIQAKAGAKVGPMPIEVRAFLAEFGSEGNDG